MANLEDFDALVAELSAADAAKENEGKEKPAEAFKMHLGGKDWEFKTQADAERALEAHMAKLESAKTASEAEIARLQAAAPKVEPQVKEGEVPEISKRFVNMLEKGDIKGISDLILKEGVFDGKIDRPSEVLADSLLRTAQMERANAANAFLALHPELRDDTQGASAVEQVRQHFGLPVTPDGFDAAYAVAVQRGMLKPAASPGGQTSMKNGLPAPPTSHTASTTGSGGPQTDEEWLRFYESRSPEELEKLYLSAMQNRR